MEPGNIMMATFVGRSRAVDVLRSTGEWYIDGRLSLNGIEKHNPAFIVCSERVPERKETMITVFVITADGTCWTYYANE